MKFLLFAHIKPHWEDYAYNITRQSKKELRLALSKNTEFH
jgi:hypothetical protein